MIINQAKSIDGVFDAPMNTSWPTETLQTFLELPERVW